MFAAEGRTRPSVVNGPFGGGKTTLVAELRKHWDCPIPRRSEVLSQRLLERHRVRSGDLAPIFCGFVS
jgi:hypothetical protein